MSFATLTGALTLDVSDFSDGVNEAEEEVGSLSGRVESAGQRMTSSGRALTAGVTAPLTAMGALAARSAANFDEAMSQSMSVMGSVSDTMEEDLRDTAQEVATSTEHSHEQAASSLYYLSSAGLDAAESMEALPAVADFASAGQMQLSEATSTTTTVMRAFGYEADEMTDVTDSLAKTVSSHNTTMEQMSTAMSQVAPVASSLGVGLDETSAAIGVMSDQGVQGERAGTALRNVLSQLSDEGSTASTQLEEMGVATRNSQGEILSMTQILENMEDASVDASEASSIFGMEAGPAMAALMEQGSGSIEDYTDNIRDSEGASSDMADIQRDTLNKQLSITRSNLEDVGVSIGSQVLPMISSLTGYVTGAAERFQGLSDGQQRTILVAGGLLAALGPVLMMFGLMAQSIVALSGAYGVLSSAAGIFAGVNTTAVIPSLATVNALLSPLLLPIYALIGAVAALAIGWSKDWGNIRKWTEEGVAGIGGLIDWLVDKLDAIPGVDIETESVEGKLRDLVGDAEDANDNISESLSERASDPFGMGEIGGTDVNSLGIDDDGQLEGSKNVEEYLEDGQDYEGAGESAGQNFGSGFNEGIVESLETEQIAEEGISQIDSEIADFQSEIEQLSSGATSHSEWQQVDELESQISSLKDERKELQNAESITDFDSELVADVAQADLESQREEAEQIESIYAELEEKGLDVEAPSNSSGADMASVQQDLDTSSSEIDAEEVDAILGNNAESTSEGGEQNQHETLRKILQEIKSTRNALETLRLRVDMDLNSREFNKIMDNRAEAVVEEQIG